MICNVAALMPAKARPPDEEIGSKEPSRSPAAMRAPSEARSVTIKMAINPITSQAPQLWITRSFFWIPRRQTAKARPRSTSSSNMSFEKR